MNRAIPSVLLCFGLAMVIGCGSGGNSNAVEDADQAAIDAYQAAQAAEQAAYSNVMAEGSK